MASQAADRCGFEGFGKDAIAFLKALGFHQSREWFHENRPIFDEHLQEPRAALVVAASEALAAANVPLYGTPKASTFRINRDVRFSKNKDPYNTHVSFVLTRNGTKKDTGGIYFMLKPGESVLASGLWQPDGAMIKAFRETMVAKPDAFFEHEDALARHGLEWTDFGRLVRVPPAFKEIEDERLRDRLRYKSFVVERQLPDKRMTSPKLVDDIVTFGEQVLPFMNFVWRVTDPVRKTDER